MKKTMRILACILTLSLLTQSLPLGVFAEGKAAQYLPAAGYESNNQMTPSELEDPAAEPDAPKEETSVAASDAFVLGELTEARGETEKRFRMSDGSYTAVDYGAPVHWSADGQIWNDIDNTLIYAEAKDGVAAGYVAENGEHSTRFAAALADGALFSVAGQDVGLQFSLDSAEDPEGQTYNAKVEAEITDPKPLPEPASGVPLAEQLRPARLESEVLYRDVWPDVDLHYQLSGFNVKESIVLNAPQENGVFSFRMVLDGLTPAPQEDGSIALLDAEGEAACLIPAPFMTDADGAYSDAVFYTLTQQDESWLFTVTADPDWLNAEARAYPVEIDPTIIDKTTMNDQNVAITYVTEGAPTTAHSSYQNVYFGHSTASPSGEIQVFLGWNTLPAIPSGNEVVYASIYLCQYNYSNNGVSSITSNIHEVTGSGIDYSNLSWVRNLTWNTRPSVSSTVLDYAVLSASTVGYNNWDISRLVKSKYKNNTLAFGACLKIANPSNYYANHDAAVYFRGYGYTNAPLFVVNYRNAEGIEGYYTYQTLDAGRAGTAYVSDYTGYLTTVTPLASLSSTVNPFTVSLVYNSSYFVKYNSNYDVAANLGLTGMHFGSGMKLNVVQKMETINLQYETNSSSTKQYLKYTDGDGTIHFFAKDPEKDPTLTKYYDEDGLGLKAVIDNASTNSYTITDDKDNQLIFIQGYLFKIKDGNGNEISIVYNTVSGKPSASARISSVVQKNNGQTAVTIATFGYGTVDGVSNYLTSLADHAGNLYTFTYGNGKLRRIYRKGIDEDTATEYVEYVQVYQNDVYNNPITGLLDKVSGYQLWFTYDGGDHGRITSYYEQDAFAQGAGVTVSERQPGEKTVYRSWGNDCVANNTDDILTSYLFDNCGRTVNVVSSYSDGTVIGASNAVYSENNGTKKGNNRLLQTAGLGMPGMSLLRNSGFEISDTDYQWTCYNNAGVNGSVSVVSEGARTGQKALKITRSTSASTLAVGAYRPSYSLTAGKTYTLSAYVNTSAANRGSSGYGVYLSVKRNGSAVAASERLNERTEVAFDGGWRRITLTFTATLAGTYAIYVWNNGMTGDVYVDDLQLELGSSTTNRNLLENGGIQLTGEWGFTNSATGNIITGEGPGIPGCSAKSLRLIGDPEALNTASQSVNVNLPGSQTYVLSGWAKANAVPDDVTDPALANDPEAAGKDTNKQFGLRAILTYSDNSTEYHYVPFNPDLTEWQFASLAIVPKEPTKTVQTINVICAYDRNANTAFFSGLSLVRELAQTMQYDEDGNLVSVKSTDTNGQTASYDGGDLTQLVTAGNGTYSYEYDDHHNLMSATNGLITQSSTVDGVGNQYAVALTSNDVNCSDSIHSSATYTCDENLLESVTDSRGNTTSYRYLANDGSDLPLNRMYGLPLRTTDAAGTQTYTTSYNDGRIKQSYISGVVNTLRDYDANKRLISITRGGYIPGNSTKQNQIYSFTYGPFDSLEEIKVGNLTLAEYSYFDDYRLLDELEYGNGATVTYCYDDLGRRTQMATSSGDSYSYQYNGEGQLYKMTDGSSDYDYYYDGIGRLIGSELRQSGTSVLQTWNSYDAAGRAAAQNWVIGDHTFESIFTYDANGRLTQQALSLPNNTSKNLLQSYDGLSRLATITSPVSSTQYSYATDADTNETTGLVSGLVIGKVNNNSLSPITLTYQYDALGRISQETQTGVGTTSYTYDVQSQLTQANRGSGDQIWNYSYDTYGNIRSSQYMEGYSDVETIAYTYGNSNWLDLLTAVSGTKNGTTFSGSYTYDGAGNPTSYYNIGDLSNWTLTWKNGRELATAGKTGVSLSFDYDVDGLRTEKTVSSSNTHRYLYAGGLLLQDRYTRNGFIYELEFVYDANGRPFALVYTCDGYTTVYYYVLNAQGDVIRLVNGSGATIANYEYDPYGRLLSVKNANGSSITNPTSIAHLNPLRYRSYYYDTETGWYYLQSRYYDPILKRFLNADSYGSTGQGFLGYNMFAYCNNNPNAGSDPTGKSLVGIIIGICVGVAVLLSGCDSDTSKKDYGAARPYQGDKISIDYSYNCAGYALDKNEWIYIKNYKKGDSLETTAENFMETAQGLGCRIRPIDSYCSPVNEDEYRIAMRVASDDYHFMRQNKDGTWSEKCGQFMRRNHEGLDPDSWSWSTFNLYIYNNRIEYEELPNYYQGDTFYFAVCP